MADEAVCCIKCRHDLSSALYDIQCHPLSEGIPMCALCASENECDSEAASGAFRMVSLLDNIANVDVYVSCGRG